MTKTARDFILKVGRRDGGEQQTNSKNKKWQKIRFKIILAMTVLITAVTCIYLYNKNNEFSPVDYSLQSDVQQYIDENGLTKCTIDKCPDYRKLVSEYKVSEQDLEVNATEEDVEEYVKRIMESYDKLVDIKGRNVVQKGDFVTVEYSVYYEGKIISPKKKITIKVGTGHYDEQFEEILIGLKKNKRYKRELTVPNNYTDKEMVGKKEVFKIEILSVQKYVSYELTDEFVIKNLGAKSVKQYYVDAKGKVLEEKRSELMNHISNKILQKVTSSCKYQLDQDAIAEYAVDAVRLQEQLADVNGMSLEDYIKENGGIEEDFYQKCYDEAEEEVKQALAIGALAAQMNIVLDETNLEELSDSSNIDGRFALVKKQVMLKFDLFQ